MIEVYKNLWVGSQNDFQKNPSFFDDWYVVHACKEPYHRQLLGYTGRGAPRNDPRYFFGYDNKHHLVLNMVDADDARFFNDGMINEAVTYCNTGLSQNKQVFIHCNKGESRAPSLALLVLRTKGWSNYSFTEAFDKFKVLYQSYNPGNGILDYLEMVWNHN